MARTKSARLTRKTKVTYVGLSEESHAKVVEIAHERECSMSDVVREAVRVYLRSYDAEARTA